VSAVLDIDREEKTDITMCGMRGRHGCIDECCCAECFSDINFCLAAGFSDEILDDMTCRDAQSKLLGIFVVALTQRRNVHLLIETPFGRVQRFCVLG
jgi:hypothetical protein